MLLSMPQSRVDRKNQSYNSLPKQRNLLWSTFAYTKSTRTGNEKGTLYFSQSKATKLPHTTQKRLPSKQFQVLLTPSSGSFSSFPHGTCSLSVSRPYLALDGTYHPLRAAIPSNSTLRLSMRTTSLRRVRGYHSPWRTFPGALALPNLPAQTPTDYNSRFEGDFNDELFPVHSQLLGES